MEKLISAQQAASRIQDGDRIMVGGFGLVGCPLTLVRAIADSQARNLTVISNNLGEPGKGLDVLVSRKKVTAAVGSFFTSNPGVVQAHLQGDLDIELIPQGTFAEAIRAGGAGIGGFYAPAGVGTKLQEGKELKVIRDKPYLFQESLTADVALIKALKADRLGNLVYRKSSRNFNPIMATAARLVIAEVDEIVEPGQLSPEEIVTPHLYVDYIVLKGESCGE